MSPTLAPFMITSPADMISSIITGTERVCMSDNIVIDGAASYFAQA